MNKSLVNGYNRLIEDANAKIKNPELDAKTKTGLKFKIGHYRKALKKIKSLETEVTSVEQATLLEVFSKGEIEHITKFLEDPTLLENSTVSLRASELDKLQGITGVGPKKATDLYDKHNLKLEDLLAGKGDDVLTHHQKMGVKYYHDLNVRIPRAEITKLQNYMRRQLSDGFKLMICGSYRRKVKASGDMDVLIYHPDVENIEDEVFFACFIEKLTKRGFLVDSLTPNDSSTKYMGMCRLNSESTVRRIDIRFIPYSSLGSAMLYFTGSGDFNKNMRTYAIKKGFKLNEYGLYKKSGEKVEGVSTEEDIFKALDLEYFEPQDRLPSVKFGK